MFYWQRNVCKPAGVNQLGQLSGPPTFDCYKTVSKIRTEKSSKMCAQYNAVRTNMYCNHSKNTARKRHKHYHVNRSDVPKAKRHAVPSERRYDLL